MALAARPIFCHLNTQKPAQRPEPVLQKPEPLAIQKLPLSLTEKNEKILLQPRLCTLRSYGTGTVIKTKTTADHGYGQFFATLSEYIESSKNSHDFEIISGRLAMVINFYNIYNNSAKLL